MSVSQQTSDLAYSRGTVDLSGRDLVTFTDKKSGKQKTFSQGQMKDDISGNFQVIGEGFFVSHRHDRWNTTGIESFYVNDRRVRDLDGIQCDYDQLFHFY